MLCYGVNQLRHAKGSSYFYRSLHAEADLVRRYPEKIPGSTILLYRFNNAPSSPVSGQPLCGKPCHLCGHLLRTARVGRVVWFGETGKAVVAKGRDFPLLTADPTQLTQMFLRQAHKSGNKPDGKFVVQNYFA